VVCVCVCVCACVCGGGGAGEGGGVGVCRSVCVCMFVDVGVCVHEVKTTTHMQTMSASVTELPDGRVLEIRRRSEASMWALPPLSRAKSCASCS